MPKEKQGAGLPERDCDGSLYCPATEHILGCFRSKPEPAEQPEREADRVMFGREQIARWIYAWRWPDDPECEQMGDEYRRLSQRFIDEVLLLHQGESQPEREGLERPAIEKLRDYETERGKAGYSYDASLVRVCTHAIALEAQVEQLTRERDEARLLYKKVKGIASHDDICGCNACFALSGVRETE